MHMKKLRPGIYHVHPGTHCYDQRRVLENIFYSPAGDCYPVYIGCNTLQALFNA